jgi:hypothetical protein
MAFYPLLISSPAAVSPVSLEGTLRVCVVRRHGRSRYVTEVKTFTSLAQS